MWYIIEPADLVASSFLKFVVTILEAFVLFFIKAQSAFNFKSTMETPNRNVCDMFKVNNTDCYIEIKVIRLDSLQWKTSAVSSSRIYLQSFSSSICYLYQPNQPVVILDYGKRKGCWVCRINVMFICNYIVPFLLSGDRTSQNSSKWK